MWRKISVEQVLHGYGNGHQMLAASYELKLDDRKKIDELSDLNGQCEKSDFRPYYTGYPINNGSQYVIAKTWYAQEMRRPGCVWTHSLIFNIEDIHKLSNLKEVFQLFTRPNSLDCKKYMNTITLLCQDEKSFPQYNSYKLQYVIYTFFLSADPKYIIVNDINDTFENELFMVINSIPAEILKTFTYCTMSYDVRKYNDSEFLYQMSSEERIYQFKRNSNRNICTNISEIKKFPYWVKFYEQSLIDNSIRGLIDFVTQYGQEYLNIVDFNCFTRLYFALANAENISLKEYFESIDTVMQINNSEVYQKTVEFILSETFSLNIFKNKEYQILELVDMKKIKLDHNNEIMLEEKIINNTPNKIYPILKKYITGNLKNKEAVLVESLIKRIKPDILPVVSNMEENICMVLIQMNEELLLCKDIWKQSKNFQCTLLYAGQGRMKNEKLKKLLTVIMENDEENISENIYEVYGEPVPLIVLDIIMTENYISDNKLDYWTKVLLRNQVILMQNIIKVPNRSYRKKIFLEINMFDKDVLDKIDYKVWLLLYKELLLGENDKKLRIRLALQFMAVIFGTNNQFEEWFIRDVVGLIYNEIKEDNLDYNDWNKFQYLLPQVELRSSWDKCLRIRNALKEKGYDVTLVEK